MIVAVALCMERIYIGYCLLSNPFHLFMNKICLKWKKQHDTLRIGYLPVVHDQAFYIITWQHDTLRIGYLLGLHDQAFCIITWQHDTLRIDYLLVVHDQAFCIITWQPPSRLLTLSATGTLWAALGLSHGNRRQYPNYKLNFIDVKIFCLNLTLSLN